MSHHVSAVPFGEVAKRVDRLWCPSQGPAHHAIFGMTGAGKTYLITRGLMAMMSRQRVLVIDVKGDDRTWDGYGTPVTHLDPGFMGQCRLDVQAAARSGTDPKALVKRALDIAADEGHMTLIIDELHTVAQTFGLGGQIESLLRSARSRECSLVLATQTIGYASVTLKDQCQFVWVGHSGDARRQRDVADVIGQPKSFLPVLQGIRGREWLYTDDIGAHRCMALTQVPSLAA